MSTTLGTAVGPLYRLDGPLPLPRRYHLLQVAQEVPLDQGPDAHWLSGAWLQSYIAGVADVFDPCASSGSTAVKPTGLPLSVGQFAAFTVNMAITCNAARVGADPYAWFVTHLVPAFRVVEAEAVERALATGDGVEIFGNDNPHLTDSHLVQLDSGAAVSPLHGLESLEDAIGATGRGGVIHATPATVTAWAQYGNLIDEDNAGILRAQATGTPIVVGDGYLDVFPDGGSSAGARQAWAFATGMVRYLADPPTSADPLVIPGQYRQAIDTSTNEVTYRAERNYLVTFDTDTTDGDNPPLQAGVLIDRSLSTP